MENKRYFTKIFAVLVTIILILQVLVPTVAYAADANSEYFRIKDTNLTVSDFKQKYAENIADLANQNIYKENTKVADTDLVATGMTIRSASDNTVLYTIVVRGDINCDGKISATDLSQFKMHETSIEKIDGARLEAADINYDGRISVLDRSQLKMLLVGLSLPDDEITVTGEIKIVPSSTEIAKEITVTVTWPQNTEGLTKQISINNGQTFETYTEPVVVKENTTVIARLVNTNGKVVASASLELTNIDSTAPESFELSVIHKIANYITLSGNTTDAQSGIEAYFYSYDDGQNWTPKSGTTNTTHTFTNIPAASLVKLRMKATDKVGNETITESKAQRTFSTGIDILKKRLSNAITIDEELQTITLPDGRAYRLTITETGGYNIVAVGTKDNIATQDDMETKLSEFITNLEQDGPKTTTEILEAAKEQGLGEINGTNQTLMIELTSDYIFYRVVEKEDGTHEFTFVDRILKNGLTASGQNIEVEVVNNMQTLLEEMSASSDFTVAGFLQAGVDRGYVLEENINKTQGTFEIQIENGPVYKVAKTDEGYTLELVGLAEEIQEGLIAQRIEEELIKGLKGEILDWAIADGLTTEDKVDRDEGTYETNNGEYKKVVINLEAGDYGIEDATKPDGAKITYTENPQFPTMTNMVELGVKAEYEKGITKVEIISELGEVLDQKQYSNNPTTVEEQFNLTANGTYIIRVTTTDGKVTEKSVFIAQIGSLLPIGVTITPEEPRNTVSEGTQNGVETGPITVTLKYSENVTFDNEDRYQYQIGSTTGTWTTANTVERIEGITENCTIYARYWDGQNSLKQIAIVIDIVDNVAPNAFEYSTIVTSHSITIQAETTDTAADSKGNPARDAIAGIDRYEYRINDGEWQLNPTFEDLTQETNYKIDVRAIDFAGNETMATNNGSSVKTTAVPSAKDVIEFKYSNTELTKDSVNVTIDTSKVTDTSLKVEYQIVTRNPGESDEQVIQKLQDDSWVEGTEYTATGNCVVVVRLSDITGQVAKDGGYALGEVKNIDNLAPMEFTPELTARTNDSLTIKAETKDAEATGSSLSSGIANYNYYLIPTAGEIQKVTNIAETTYTFEGLKAGGLYGVYVEAYDNAGNMRLSEQVTFVTNAKVGEIVEGATTITGLDSDEGYNNPIIPVGFAPIDTDDAKWGDGEDLPEGWDQGLTIQDKDENQFVWVPVDGEDVKFEKWTTSGISHTNTTDGEGVTTASGEAIDEKEQVDTYKGYYVSRYESGKVSSKVVSRAGENPWTGIRYESAKQKAESMYQTSGVQSGLITGTQWDTLMKWIANEKGESYVTTDLSWGNYTNEKHTTAYNEAWKVKNLYDLSGNVQEFTNELSQGQVVVRGGAYNQNSAVATRSTYSVEYTNANLGFRTVLYVIKDAEYEPSGDDVLGIGNINAGPGNQTVNGLEPSYLNPVVPVGFMAVNTPDAHWTGVTPSGWNNGLVIEDVNGNQFVWVPVDGTMVTYSKNSPIWVNMAEGTISGDELPTALQELGVQERAQVDQYGGFYIGRYEAGNDEGSLASKAGLRTVNAISYQTAKDTAEGMYNTPYVKSGLPTGTIWDTTMTWIANQYGQASVTNNWTSGNNRRIDFTFSGEYAVGPQNSDEVRGEYQNGTNVIKPGGESYLIATGLVDQFKLKNIYDLAGNVWEYTSEYSVEDGVTTYIARGLDYYRDNFKTNSNWGAAIRENLITPPGEVRNESGFRVVLYLAEGATTVGQFANYNRTMNGQQASYDNPVIPAGFAPINTEDANWGNGTTITPDWNSGLVIEDEAGNQFVWVPVDGTTVTYDKWTERGLSYKDTDEDDIPEALTRWNETEQTQVSKYGGFYVARYETSQAENGRPQSVENVNAWTSIDYTKAKEAAENMETKETVQSGLITGTQWDTLMKWISGESSIGENGVISDSTSWGNYNNSNLGRNAKAKNIFEIAGGSWEWTAESYGESKVYRGGVSTDAGSDSPAAYRGSYEITKVDEATSFRMVLYITGDVIGIAKVPVTDSDPLPGTIFPGNANKPELVDGLTPVKWNGQTWVKTTETDPQWYDYSDVNETGANTSKWANAMTPDGSIFVWIPRYAYKIDQSNKKIDVVFLDGVTNEPLRGINGRVYAQTSGNITTFNSYVTHPTFRANTSIGGWDTELPGIWVGKYMTRGSGTQAGPRQNGSPIRTNTNGSILVNTNRNATLGMTAEQRKNVDTHMAKNSEWGAFAYLAFSQYGTNGAEIGENTTGNVYGIREVNSNQYVASYGTVSSIRFQNVQNIITAAGKYTQYYANGSNTFYGDALWEVSGFPGYVFTTHYNGTRPHFQKQGAFAQTSQCSNTNLEFASRMVLIVTGGKTYAEPTKITEVKKGDYVTGIGTIITTNSNQNGITTETKHENITGRVQSIYKTKVTDEQGVSHNAYCIVLENKIYANIGEREDSWQRVEKYIYATEVEKGVGSEFDPYILKLKTNQ